MTTTVPLAPWEFFDYVEDNGNNQISAWLRDIPVGARAEFEALLDAIKPRQQQPTRPQTGKLYGGCEGLFEFVVKHANVQYRPLFVFCWDILRLRIYEAPNFVTL